MRLVLVVAALVVAACDEPIEKATIPIRLGQAVELDASDRVVPGEDLVWVIQLPPLGQAELLGQGTPRLRVTPLDPGAFSLTLLVGSGPTSVEVFWADITVYPGLTADAGP